MMKGRSMAKYKITRLTKFKLELRKWLHIEDDSHVDVICGVVMANRLDTKPVWLYIVDVASSGKTTIVEAMDGHPTIYATSYLTNHALSSGQIRKPGEPDPSLLPKLHNKILIVKDLTRMLDGAFDKTKEVIGQLRDAYDGSSRNCYGTGQDTQYRVKFGFIAAVTEEIYKHSKLFSSLGERCLILRPVEPTPEERKKRIRQAALNKSDSEQEESLRTAAHHFLDMKPKRAVMPEELLPALEEMAELVAIGRTPVERDPNSKLITKKPRPEEPLRLVKQLVSLAIGIAMARQKLVVTPSEIELACRVGVDSMPPVRSEVLLALAELYPDAVTAEQLADKFSLPKSTVKHWLADVYALRLVTKRTLKPDGKGRPAHAYVLKRKYVDRLSPYVRPTTIKALKERLWGAK